MIPKQKIQLSLSILLLLFSSIFMNNIHAQTLPLPYVINNLSEFNDDEIYVALVGKIDGADVWIDMSTNEVKEMSITDNTLQGPTYNGNKGPGGNAKYADVFTLLSDIPNKTIEMPNIYAVRIFISFKSPLYLYFFGEGGGYSAPSLSNDSDPNLGLKYELVELTYGSNGLWTNTTRVDAYQYPMGLEVWGSDGFYKRVGEVLTHEDILEKWRTQVSDAFQGSLDENLGIILNPSKSATFQKGAAYNNYFSDYVDAVWSRYESEDMYLSIGEAGVWVGHVENDQFIFTNQSDGSVGIISDKPNTLEILEASGVLAEDVESTESIHADQNVQKHFSAAFNRGAIDINAATGELLEWSNLDTYFGENTHNQYVAFFHSEDVSFEGETYAFAYDDVFDYSSTIQSTVPEKVKITIGGFVNDPYVAPTSISLSEGDLSLQSGETKQLSATLLPTNVNNDAIVWSSTDTAVATVSEDGFITAISTGTTSIIASSYDGSVSDSITVEVNGGDYSTDETIRIQAENYTDMSGIQTESTNDIDGGLNVGWIDNGDYLEYNFNVDTAGTYTIAYRISSIHALGAVEVQVNGESVLLSNFESTGSWARWTTHVDTLTLPAGDVTLRLLAKGDGWNLNWIDLTPVDVVDNTNTEDTTDDANTEDENTDTSTVDENGSVLIEAEDYSDMYGIQTEVTLDSSGDLNVGWIRVDDYMEYNINVATAGEYTVGFRVATISDDASFEIQVNGELQSLVTLDSTGGWAHWETQNRTVTLPAGEVTIRLVAKHKGWNLNWFNLELN